LTKFNRIVDWIEFGTSDDMMGTWNGQD